MCGVSFSSVIQLNVTDSRVSSSVFCTSARGSSGLAGALSSGSSAATQHDLTLLQVQKAGR